jgi:flagellar operon protein
MSTLANTALLPPVGVESLAGAQKPGTSPAGASTSQGGAPGAPQASFADALKHATGPDAAGGSGGSQALSFSRHALERVQRRGISLDPTTMTRLQDGVGRAAGKGSRNSVVLVDGTAFVVSVNNRTVVTAVGPEHMREHVFTNVDSAVIA